MFSVLVVVLGPDQIAGQGFSSGQREIPLIASLRALRALRPRAGSLHPHQKTLWLIGAGAVMIALGVLWGLQFPIVKNIWTSSYVLVCGGLSALLLGVFHQVIDAWGRRSWATTFIWIGASAITLYLINGIVGATQLIGGDVGSFVDSHLTPGAGSLLAHAVGLLIAVALRVLIPPQNLSVRVTCAGTCLSSRSSDRVPLSTHLGRSGKTDGMTA